MENMARLSIAVVDNATQRIYCGLWEATKEEMDIYNEDGQAEFIWNFADHHGLEHPAQFMFTSADKMVPMEAAGDVREHFGLQRMGIVEIPGMYHSSINPTMENAILQSP